MLEMNLNVLINAAPPAAMTMNVLVITLYTTAPLPQMFRWGLSLWGLCTDGRGRLGGTIFSAAGGCLSLNPRRREDLLLVQGVVLQDGLGERIQLSAMLGEESHCIGETLVRDALGLHVDLACGCFAIRAHHAESRTAVLGKCQRPDLRAHAPSHHHLVSDLRDLL